MTHFSSKQSYSHGYTAEGSVTYNHRYLWERLAGLKGLMMSQKILQFAFFCLFLLKMCRNLQQTVTFHLWAKALPLLNPFSPGILCEIDIKRNNNINNKKKRFSESSFNLIYNCIIFCGLFRRGYTSVGLQDSNVYISCRARRVNIQYTSIQKNSDK